MIGAMEGKVDEQLASKTRKQDHQLTCLVSCCPYDYSRELLTLPRRRECPHKPYYAAQRLRLVLFGTQRYLLSCKAMLLVRQISTWGHV